MADAFDPAALAAAVDPLTVDEVRDGYVLGVEHDCMYEGDVLRTPDGMLSAARFDRFLAELPPRAVSLEGLLAVLGHLSTPPRHNIRSAHCKMHPSYMANWLELCPACEGAPDRCARCETPFPCAAVVAITEAIDALAELEYITKGSPA